MNTDPRYCVFCGHEERFSDNEGGICQKLGTVVVPGGEGVTTCDCQCVFPQPEGEGNAD